ncbi:hypothetical protein PITCH_A560002 [uncultured Desulfobacterium sp.]|uniref:Uncharacterized protein n=1 Tax=uncultured Desulfobacterium sp. TaxID=201089 RepID=A0A445N178_9BACT|nr:hypothetical protein PITCH_A560002 [uncultured Desulfobacterium sp.]
MRCCSTGLKVDAQGRVLFGDGIGVIGCGMLIEAHPVSLDRHSKTERYQRRTQKK